MRSGNATATQKVNQVKYLTSRCGQNIGNILGIVNPTCIHFASDILQLGIPKDPSERATSALSFSLFAFWGKVILRLMSICTKGKNEK